MPVDYPSLCFCSTRCCCVSLAWLLSPFCSGRQVGFLGLFYGVLGTSYYEQEKITNHANGAIKPRADRDYLTKPEQKDDPAVGTSRSKGEVSKPDKPPTNRHTKKKAALSTRSTKN